MSVIVIDSSVVIKWFVPEVHSGAARRLLKQAHQYFAPDLLFAEVGNVLWKKVRQHELTASDAERLVHDVAKAAIASVPCRELVPDAHAIAVSTGRTVYDAMYLALAVRLRTKVITSDARLWNAISGIAILANHIELLTERS